ncbi:MAG: kelch repeat-containing protein [Spartobacteria bacterium]
METRALLLWIALVSLLGLAALQAQTIPLSPERTGHTATLLNSGKVLIAGGVNETATIASSLLYDPANGTLVSTGSMVTARADHTATLLPDGRVLITGGDQGFSPLQTAELYNPTTGTFSLTTQQMTSGRSQHTATLLPSGKVLVNGGGSADLFDPAAQTFTKTSGMPVSRKGHASILLGDGTVLVMGGYVNTIATKSAEIYDPATQAFTATAHTMQVARANMGEAPLPDGRVLITGGFSGTSPHDETEVYDPLAKTFTVDASMVYHRSNHHAFLQGDGRVVVIGGVTIESGFLAADEVYNPATKVWSTYAPMLENRGGYAAAVLKSGNIFIAGGVTGNLTLQTAEILNPTTGQFTSLGKMQVPRNQHRANLLADGKVLLTAGSTDGFNLSSNETFNPTNNTFSLVGSMVDVRKSHTATTLQDGRVMVAGGKGAGYLKTAEIYDPATLLFHSASPMAGGRGLHTETLLNSGKVLVTGGVTTGGVSIKTAELFDPVTETFSSTGNLELQRKRHRAALLNDGKVLVMGGDTLNNVQGGGDRETETAERFDPATGIFTPVGSMSLARAEHEATKLLDGTVLVTGGTTAPELGELYQPGTATFATTTGTMVIARGRHVSLRLTNPAWGSSAGKVLSIGGAAIGGPVFGGGQQAQDSVEIYDPATKLFTNFGTMTEPRQNLTATELNDGRILIAGGVGRPFVSATAEVLAGPSPSPTPPPTPTPTPTGTIPPSPSPSPSGSPSPTPTATPLESKPLNISTRADAQTGDKVLIGGFILTGGSEPKTVILRAIGPSLPLSGILADPVLELHNPDGSVVVNDNWRDSQESEITASGLAPGLDQESAIIATLGPGLYTAIVYGKDNGTGVGLVEVYDLDDPNTPTYLANISTRGFVQPDDNAMIGGFIISEGGQTGQVVVRAIGPSLTTIPDALRDPTLNVYDGQGAVVAQNDNWADTDGDAIATTGLAPTNDLESAVLANLSPGAYTAIVRGKATSSGVGLVEVYYLP